MTGVQCKVRQAYTSKPHKPEIGKQFQRRRDRRKSAATLSNSSACWDCGLNASRKSGVPCTSIIYYIQM